MNEVIPIGGLSVRQSGSDGAAPAAAAGLIPDHSAAAPAVVPVREFERVADKSQRFAATPAQRRMLGFEEVRQKLGVSARKARQIVAEAWFPDPIELGPRCLRWVDAEIDEALAARAPRRPEPAPEPAQLVRGRDRNRQAVPA